MKTVGNESVALTFSKTFKAFFQYRDVEFLSCIFSDGFSNFVKLAS
jgi:hypothetical protein